MIRFWILTFLFIFTTSPAHALFDGQGYTRAEADSDPATLRARSYFAARTKQLYSQSQRRYRVTNVALTMSYRMVAQRGRGAASANAVLPVELDHLLKFISDARYRRDEILTELLRQPALRKYKSDQIENAVAMLSSLRKIHLNYWGYIGRRKRLPEYSNKDRTLTYFAKWNENASRYELYSENTQRLHVIAGLIESLNKTSSFWPW